MHDGRFSNLREILSHYSSVATQKYFQQKLKIKPIELTAIEKTDLIAFLLTLNDEEFVFNPDNKFPMGLITKTKERN